MISNNIDDLSREDLLKILARDRFVKEQLAQQVGGLSAQNAELFGLVQELQSELTELQSALTELRSADPASPAEEVPDN